MNHDHLCITLVPLFNHLPLKDQQRINQVVNHRNISKGEMIMSPGKAELVIVAKGAMKLFQLSSNGKEQLLRVVEPGAYEGETLLFGAENENLFGEALQPTEVCVIPKQDFQQLLNRYPELTLKLLEINAKKMNAMQQQTQFLMMEKVEERLATYLLDLAKVEASNHFLLPMKMKELAAFLGTTPETLSRKFKLLENQQTIKREGYEVSILSVDALEDI